LVHQRQHLDIHRSAVPVALRRAGEASHKGGAVNLQNVEDRGSREDGMTHFHRLWPLLALWSLVSVRAGAGPDYRLGMCHGGGYSAMVAAGIGWSRHDLTWSAAEPERGTFNWGWYDDVVTRAEQAGLKILPILCYSAAYWGSGGAQPDEPRKFEDYGRFAYQAALHYKGRMDAFEVWNEPNLGGFWQGEPNAGDYVSMLRQAYGGIKRANPRATVIGGSIAAVGNLDWPYLEAMFAHGAAQYMDALSLHPYRPTPEAGQPKIAYRVRKLLAAYGVADMPVWITEEGWALPDDPRTATDEAWHANYFVRSTLISWAVGNAVHIWYAWGGPWGLARDGGFRPAYRACQTLTRVIGERKPVGFLPLTWPNYGVVFADESGAIAALWRPFGKDTITLDLPAAGANLLDQYGEPLPLRGRRVNVVVTPAVTYVTGLGREATRLAAAQVYPREVSLEAGRSDVVKVWVTRAEPEGRVLGVNWTLPAGWSAQPAQCDGVAYDGTHKGMTAWRLRAPRDARIGRYVVRGECRIAAGGAEYIAPLTLLTTVRPPLAWIYAAPSPVYSACVAADIDADGKTEIIGAARWQQIFCLDGAGREKWRYQTAAAMNSNPAVADLDGDGTMEIVAAPEDGGLIALGADGRLRWRTDLGGRCEWGGPAIADLNGDGRPEIAVTGEKYGACVAADGRVLWRIAMSQNAGGQPAVGDLDGDGRVEVVFPCDDGLIRCCEPDGSVRWLWRTGAAASPSPIILDPDGDGRMEVVFGSADRAVTGAAGPDGAQRWRFAIRGDMDSALAAGDVNGDGRPEIVAGDLAGGFYCIGRDGTQVWSTGIAATTECAPAIADLDGDGRLELVVGDTGGTITCFDSTGQLVWQFEAPNKIAATPLVADVNDDGRLELVVGCTDNRVYCFSLSGPASGRRPWPSARGNPANTGRLAP
jgi:outer membrane protein assembly factor BamB